VHVQGLVPTSSCFRQRCSGTPKTNINKQGQCQHLFLEFKQKERPTMPPTLYKGGNAMSQAERIMGSIIADWDTVTDTWEESPERECSMDS
jgi:hypothetical protein